VVVVGRTGRVVVEEVVMVGPAVEAVVVLVAGSVVPVECSSPLQAAAASSSAMRGARRRILPG